MNNIKISLLNIIGKIRKMTDYFLAWGNIYLPIGVIFWLLALDKVGNIAWFFFVCGVVFIVLGIIAMSKAWNRVKAQENEKQNGFKELIAEIKGLRQDLRAEGKK